MYKKKNRIINIINIISIFIIFLGVVLYIHYQHEHKKANVSKVENHESSEAKEESKTDILNIVLLGIDSRSKEDVGRSDSIILLSIHKRSNKIKVCSIMRDTYVKIEGRGMTKINHAYAYGGPELAVRTINENFNMNIEKYIVVDFEEMKNIVDTLGGVEVEIKSYEIPEMKCVGIYSQGKFNLNGAQALAYSRIRYEGDGDYERTERQRTILSKIIDKIKQRGVGKYPQLVEELISSVYTNISKAQILNIGISIFNWNMDDIEKERFPRDGYCQGKTIDGVWYLITDLESTAKQLNEYMVK